MSLSEAKTNDSNSEAEAVASLVDLAITGDEDAWTELVKMSWPDVYAVALRRTRNTADADDVVQTTYEKVHRSLEQINDRQKFLPWIKTIASRMAVNFVVREKSKRAYTLDTTLPIKDIHATSPLQPIIDKEFKAKMLSLFHMLSSDIDKKMLTLRYQDDMSMKEMQAALEEQEGRAIPLGTVKRRLFTARKRLRELIEECN